MSAPSRSLAHDPSIAAANPGSSAWVVANAGSGKTYTLANRVTRLLLARAKPERILCLTYTKAAAAEMQTRLFAQLGEFAMLPDDTLSARLTEVCGAEAAFDLPLARRLFAQALETPGGLKIQTIHGFCQSVLGRFPLEAGIAPGFDVLDEQTSSALMSEARERVLERADTGDEVLARAIARLVTEISERRLSDFLGNCLGTDRRKIERFFQTLPGDGGALARSMRRAHDVADGDTVIGIAEEFLAIARAEKATLEATVQWMLLGSARDQKRAADLRTALAVTDPKLAFDAFRDAFFTTGGGRYKEFVTKNYARSNAPLNSYIESFSERFCEFEVRRRGARASEMCHAMLVLADAVRREYAQAKHARGVLDYDDLIVETSRLLEKSEAAQWILFKLDGGIDHVLIDEAQDTSPEQWEIVRRLTEEFFAGLGTRGEAANRTIFAVGDEKQSIFSFQGAEPEKFEEYRAHFEKRALAAERDFVSEPLATSRRSAPEVLKFVDEVFRDDEAREGLTTGGGEIRHFAHRRDAKGRVEFWLSIKAPKEPEPDPMREVDLPSEASAAAQLARKVADQIQNWRVHKVRLPGHDEPIRPRDVMILLPRREPFGSLVIRELKDRNIPVSGADRMLLTDEIAVLDLIALGRFALQPDDDLTLATVLRSPFCRVSENALLDLCHPRKGRLWDELANRREERTEFADAHEFLSDMLGRADFVPPFEFYAHALIARGMRMRLVSRLGPEVEDAIEEFLALAFAFEKSHAPALEAFLDWTEKGGAEIKRDMERGRDEVRVMTVHGAKGLEADIVFLPDTCTLPQTPAQKAHLLYREQEILFPANETHQTDAVSKAKDDAFAALMREHRRLLYVALTRAKDRLYICGFETKNGVKAGSWYQLCERAATSIGTPLINASGETIRVIGDAPDETASPAAEALVGTEIPKWVAATPLEVARPRLLRPSDAVSGDAQPANSPFGRKGVKRFARGLLVHALLANLPAFEPAKRREVGRRFLRTRVEDDAEIDPLLDETLAVVDDPVFAEAFAPGSRAEVALTAELSELGEAARINGRIDRLAVTDRDVLIVDFKTNRPPPVREEDVAPVYLAQMALYRAAATNIFPGRRVACALVWTDGPRLMRLSDGILARQLGEIRARLDPTGTRS